MKTRKVDNAKLGLFVLAGVLFIIFTLYMIGKNRNLFGATFTITAVVSNVNGLVSGNNVRFKGIDVGTVKDIAVVNDSLIYVTLTIDNAMKPYIRENAMASIGTDGLMGNKLLNINSVPGDARPVEQGSVIQSQKPIETDEMLRTLNTTNNNLERISYNLKEVTVKLNNSKSLWNLLSDTLITLDLRNAVRDFRRSGSNLAEVTQTTKNIVSRFDRGDGLAGALFTDSTLTQSLAASLSNIQQASDKASHMVENLETVIAQLKSGEGTAGLLLSDTTLRNALLRSGENVEEGTARFNQNMEALKTNFFFKGYFKKLEKEERKSNTNQQ